MQLGRTYLLSIEALRCQDDCVNPAITNILNTYVTEYYAQVDPVGYFRLADPIPFNQHQPDFVQRFVVEKIKTNAANLAYGYLFHCLAQTPSNTKHPLELYVPGSKYGKIRQQVVRAINSFFNIRQLGFGDSFYFTRTATYIHQEV